MNSSSKAVNSSAIKLEIKRYDSLQSAIVRLAKQFERVEDQQLRSGLKVYLHGIQAAIPMAAGCNLLCGPLPVYRCANCPQSHFLSDKQGLHVHSHLRFHKVLLMKRLSFSEIEGATSRLEVIIIEEDVVVGRCQEDREEKRKR
ncbi:unnamed protein product [Pleuronectes platessa]|uniref:Uncharacterized protein n=1 Tax=Pleuronectes platessa TaxID=8262 RepID=A0A9N7ZAB6_PLEPL|nr:unnamed protein product [Pleuronectes platessa]